ncbi:MAG TPA: ArsA family ATPase [Dehalococcoidia bacterium]
MRIVLYLGKGGVGKTTTSAASAVRSAALGHRTLVVSTDIAHSLADVLDRPLGDEPVPIAANLWGQEINVIAEMRRRWQEVRPQLNALLRREGLDEVAAEELAIVPGMDELVALAQVNELSQSGSYDAVFVDAAPTGETIRLLSVPETVPWYVERVQSLGKKIPRIARPLAKNVMGEAGGFLDYAERLSGLVTELRATLANPEVSSYRLVVTPERMVVKEALRAQTYLNLFGYPIDAVVLNQVLPAPASDDPFLRQLWEQQQGYVRWVEDSFRPLPILRAPRHAREPIGLAALNDLAESLFGQHDPTLVLHHGPTQLIEPIGGGYRMRIPMPNVEAERLNMAKRGDELFVDVGNIRREIALPRALAPLEAAGAMLHDGFLEIRFAPPAEPQAVASG